MKFNLPTLAVGLMLALPFNPALSMETKMSDQEKTVIALVDQMNTAFREQRTDDIIATYEEEAIVMFNRAEPIRGKEALIAGFEAAYGANPVFILGEHEAYVASDIALHITPWTMTGKLPDGTEISDTGLSVAVMRRQADGNWLMVIDNPHGSRLLAQ